MSESEVIECEVLRRRSEGVKETERVWRVLGGRARECEDDVRFIALLVLWWKLIGRKLGV